MSIDRLVFIDETWATTNMTRRFGRALRGHRLVASVPHGHWKTTTFIGALRSTGLTAPAVFDGAINGMSFLAYVEQNLVPDLRPGDIVVLDNLSTTSTFDFLHLQSPQSPFLSSTVDDERGIS